MGSSRIALQMEQATVVFDVIHVIDPDDEG
jgi:hypothetical protein